MDNYLINQELNIINYKTVCLIIAIKNKSFQKLLVNLDLKNKNYTRTKGDLEHDLNVLHNIIRCSIFK